MIFFTFLPFLYAQDYLSVQAVQETLSQNKAQFQCSGITEGMHDVSFSIDASGKATSHSKTTCFDALSQITFAQHPHTTKTVLWKILYQEQKIVTQEIFFIVSQPQAFPSIISSDVDRWSKSIMVEQ